MTGLGAANLAAGSFQGFPVSTSASRTAVAERAWAKTQLTGLTGTALIVVVIVLVPGLLQNLPSPALAAVVITVSISLADIPPTARLGTKTEFLLSIATLLGVALLGVLPGIAIAVSLSILTVFGRAWRPCQTVLGRVAGLEGYHDVHMHPRRPATARTRDLPFRRPAILRQCQNVPGTRCATSPGPTSPGPSRNRAGSSSPQSR